MVERVKAWLRAGREVRIMTARAANLTPVAKNTIETWCKKHLGHTIPITHEKDPAMNALWDDRAVAVARNRGYSKKAAWITLLHDRNGEAYRVDEQRNLGMHHYRVVDEDHVTIAEIKVQALNGDRFPEGTHGLCYWHTDPAYRGLGIGTSLLDFIIKEWGTTPLVLGVQPFDKVGESGFTDRNSPLETDLLRKRYRARGFERIPGTTEMIRWPEGEAHAVDAIKQAAVVPITLEGIPTTGPEAIREALASLDLEDLEAEAKQELQKKTKRPKAIKRLNILEGLRRNRISPEEYMVTKIPVVPPLFRQYAVEGDTFIPGDANELYRDFFKAKQAYTLENEAFGTTFGDTAKALRDSVRALYGYGDPVEPKTKERGVSGFMAKLTGDGSPNIPTCNARCSQKPWTTYRAPP
jgi:DNA-directed RNA polymerase beta' subunit